MTKNLLVRYTEVKNLYFLDFKTDKKIRYAVRIRYTEVNFHSENSGENLLSVIGRYPLYGGPLYGGTTVVSVTQGQITLMSA